MKLLVQDFLKGKSLNDLKKEHGIDVSISNNHKKISLNYSQLETKDNDELSWDCRGLILAKSDLNEFQFSNDGTLDKDAIIGDTIILAFPMRRFFNYSQEAAAKIDFFDPDTVIQTKYDGSLIIIYADPIINDWSIATRSAPDADILMDNGIYTFRTLFEKALFSKFKISFNQFVEAFDKNKTYFFELMTPYNKIVVDHKEDDIVLLGARDNISLEEINVLSDPLFTKFPLAQEFNFNKFDEIIEYINSKPPSEMEGVVVRDKYFNRLKIKSAAYVLAHKMKDHISSSPRNCLEAILLGTDDDMIPLLPEEVVNNLLKMKEEVKKVINNYDNYYQILLNCANSFNKGDKKTFALLVTSNEKILWAAPFFRMFNGKASSMKDFIDKSKKEGTWSNSFLDKLLEIVKNSL